MKSACNDYIDYIPRQVIELLWHPQGVLFAIMRSTARTVKAKKTKPWKKGILSHALNGSFTPIKFGENWVLALARSLSSPQPAIGPDFVAVSWSYFAGTCERHWLEQWKGHTFGYEDACGPPNLDSGPILTRFDRWNRCASMVPLVCGAAATTQHHIHIQ